MKDASTALRTAYYNLLTTALDVEVYDAAADDLEGGNYVVLSTQTSNIDSSKDSFEYEHTIIVDVVTRFKGKAIGKKTAETISNQVMQAVYPTPTTSGLTITGFRIISTDVELSDLVAQFGEERIVRKLLTFTHLITEP